MRDGGLTVGRVRRRSPRVRHAAVRLRRGAPARTVPRGRRRVRPRARDLRHQGVPVPGDGQPRVRGGAAARRRHRRRAARGARRRRPGERRAPCTATTSRSTNCAMAIAAGVRYIVVDSFDELDRLDVARRRRRRADAEGRAAHHARRPRPHPRVHRHRPGRLQVRLQPRQRRRGACGRSCPSIARRSNSSGCTATSARTCSRRPRSPRPPR